ncbi:MAG: MATE family efflux transporter [Eubacterium sp.]|nr:MATE family efflux transporter [Eubacterium sp.]
MDDRIIKKMLRGTMVVMVVTVLSTMLGMLVDGIVIGRYLGQAYMSAYGLANPIFNLLIAINGVLAAGIQVLCARHIGSGDYDRAKQVHTISFLMAALISLILFAVMFFGADQIAMLLGAHGKNASLLPEASAYLRGLGIGVPPLMLAFITNSFMQIDSDQTRTIVAVVVMTIVNIAGDFINALVLHGGLFEMGMATSISYYVALLIALTHYLKKNNVLTFTIKGLRIRDALKVMKLGAPSGVVNLFITLRNIVMNRLLLLVATPVAVAAFSIQNTLTAATGAISTGLGMAVLLVSGIIAGERDRVSAVNLVRIMYKLGLAIALGEMAVCLIFASPLAGIFAGSDQQLLGEATYCVRIYAFGFIGNVLNSMMENYVQGMGRVALANLLVILDTFVYCVIIAWVLGFGFSLPLGYIWASWAIGEALVLLTTFFMAWKKQGHFPRRAADYSFFPEGFGVEPEDCLEKSVYKADDLTEMGLAVEQFCENHGSGATLAKKIHLCLEEMGANIIQHGFGDGKEHSIDVRVIRKEDGFTIRMRDDCKAFDPKEWYEIHHPEDVTKNIGIRLVMKLAQDVQYVNTMQLNNLIIEV